MEATLKNIGDVAIIRVGGRIDATNNREFKAAVAQAAETQQKILIDMAAVEFVDSSGLGALVSCLKSVSAAGGDLRLCTMNKSVRTLFELTRMHRVFQIHNTLDEAIAVFSE